MEYFLANIIKKHPEAKKEAIEAVENEIKGLNELKEVFEEKFSKKISTTPLELIKEWDALLKYLKEE